MSKHRVTSELRKGCNSAISRSGCIGVPLRVADSRLSSARSAAIAFRIVAARSD